MTVIIQPGYLGTEVDLDHPRLCWRKQAGSISWSSGSPGFSGLQAYEEDLISAWRPTVVPANWEINFTGTPPISYVGIGAHTIGSSGATIKLQVFDGTWQDIPGTEISPTDDEAILYLLAPQDISELRVRMTVAIAEIGYILTGLATEIPRKAQFTGLPISESQQVDYRDNTSMTGRPLGRTLQKDGLEFSVEVNNLPEEFRADEWRAFREAMERGGRQFFFYAAKPEKYPDEVALAWQRQPAPFERTQPNKRISGAIKMTCGGYRQK